MSERVSFQLAVDHFCRARSEPVETGVGWKSTCGSAERMYAGEPSSGLMSTAVLSYDPDIVARVQRLVKSLDQFERDAWLKSLKAPLDGEEAHRAERARVRLIMWWSGVPV